MKIDNPYHEGELLVQQNADEAEWAQRNGAVIADTIPKGALRFIAQQSLAVLGSLDVDGNVWASVLMGDPGFLMAPNERSVELDATQRRSAQADPLWSNIETNNQIGVLVIDLATRRRLRISGSIHKVDDSRFELTVEQAYPNCPKHIQRRHLSERGTSAPQSTNESSHGIALTEGQCALIAAADTFFVASANPEHGIDASHRGGQPGFVRMLDSRHLRIPDYAGNSMFNTLGNFAAYPHAGLVFMDFERGRVLQLTGRAEILWNQNDPGDETGGTGRYWELEIEHWVETSLPRQFRWELLDYSPHNPQARGGEDGGK